MSEKINPKIKAVIPQIEFADITNTRNEKPKLIFENDFVSGNISSFEIKVISTIVKNNQVKTAMEIGTFNGRTTCNIANNMVQDGCVWTFDLEKPTLATLPLQVKNHSGLSDDELGFIGKKDKLFHDKVFPAEIKQVWSDSAEIKDHHYPIMDFIFIDGSHSFEYAHMDTITAFNMIDYFHGIIMWHDYGGWPGVTKALNNFYQFEGITSNIYKKMRWIKDTSLVVLFI